ncbi:MAG: hypothetical protein AAB804_01700 [Patescibacteria group bacterium]
MSERIKLFVRSALILCTLSLVLFFAILDVATAQEFVPLAETPSGSKLGQLYSSGSISDFINGLFKFAITIGAVAAVLRIAYAGYLYMGQADMWSSKGKAKGIIADVTLGLLLLLAIYLILNQINPAILELDTLKNIAPPSGS